MGLWDSLGWTAAGNAGAAAAGLTGGTSAQETGSGAGSSPSRIISGSASGAASSLLAGGGSASTAGAAAGIAPSSMIIRSASGAAAALLGTSPRQGASGIVAPPPAGSGSPGFSLDGVGADKLLLFAALGLVAYKVLKKRKGK